MTALTVRRLQVPFWPLVVSGAVAWVIAWMVNQPLADWAAYGRAAGFRRNPAMVATRPDLSWRSSATTPAAPPS